MKKRVIKRLAYKDEFDNPQEATVGHANVVSIVEFSDERGVLNYDINFEGGDRFKVFQPVFVASTEEQYTSSPDLPF